jgi:[ribosomal protein S5]-alanine N-acetyltransferase
MPLAAIQTERLLLRPFDNLDVTELVRLAGAREVAATTLRIPHPYADGDAEQFIARCRTAFEEGSSAVFAICLRLDAGLCGATGLHITPAHHRAELGYWIGVPYWGRGYCQEAVRAVIRYGFEELNLHRIYASHFRHNSASGAILRRIGMHYEGRRRDHVWKWGKSVDLEMYGLLKSEYVSSGS